MVAFGLVWLSGGGGWAVEYFVVDNGVEVKTMMEGISCVLNATWADSLGLIGLYTDESPGLKVDPVVVLVLSLGFIFSVVALHSTLSLNLLTPSLLTRL